MTPKTASTVRVLVLVEDTRKARARWPALDELVVAEFMGTIPLYRIFDENELQHILRSGKITGGNYSVPAERSFGASWGSNVTQVIEWGNRLRGKRLGSNLYLAKIDGYGHRFLHLSPEIKFDIDNPEPQKSIVDSSRFNVGLGCSVADVGTNEAEFYVITEDHRMHSLDDQELRALKKGSSAQRVAARFLQARDQYFELGDIVTYGKYKNHRGKIVNFGKDKWGNPTVEVEPIPKGRKQNKVFGLFKIWRADVKEKALAEQAAKEGLTARVIARFEQAKGTPRGWEHRKEKDDFTEQNIPPEYLVLWRKLKNRFKGTPHERAEQFMEYVEEHPGENTEALQENADKEVAKMTREWAQKHREQVKLEKECDKTQTKYEDAWYKEQERATKEKNNLKQLQEKAEGACKACPTCDESEGPRDYPDSGGHDDNIPFAASRVAARFAALEGLPRDPSPIRGLAPEDTDNYWGWQYTRGFLDAGPLPHLASRVRSRFRRDNARRTAAIAGALPLPPELQGHPALTQGLTTIENANGFLGTIEDEAGTWIAWVEPSGEAVLYTNREPDGGTIGDGYAFRRDDLVTAPTLTVPNPLLRHAPRQEQGPTNG